MEETSTGDSGEPHLFPQQRDIWVRRWSPRVDPMGVACSGRRVTEARGWFQHFGERSGASGEVVLLFSNHTKTQLSYKKLFLYLSCAHFLLVLFHDPDVTFEARFEGPL